MATTSTPPPGTCPIKKLPAELLENILLFVADDVTPPIIDCTDRDNVVYRYEQEEEPFCTLAFRLASRTFCDSAWRAFGTFLGETVFDLRSRKSISNLTALSACKALAPWITKITIACTDGLGWDEVMTLPYLDPNMDLDDYHEFMRIK
jgi:hypothetical protein